MLRALASVGACRRHCQLVFFVRHFSSGRAPEDDLPPPDESGASAEYCEWRDELYRQRGPDGRRKTGNFWPTVADYERAKRDTNAQLRREIKDILREERDAKHEARAALYEKWKREADEEGARSGGHGDAVGGAAGGAGDGGLGAAGTSGAPSPPPSGPRDTHFDTQVRAQRPEDIEPLIASLEESLKLQSTVSGGADLPLARSLEELALLCHQRGVFSKAVKYYLRALRIHQMMAAAALAEKSRGKSEGGGRYIRLSFEPQYTFQNSPFTSKEAYDMMGDEEEFRRLGSPDIANTLGHLGVCFRDAGCLEKADELLQATVKIKTALYGNYHESLAETLNNLGAIRHAQGDFAAAIDCYEDAVQALIGATGTRTLSDPHVAMAYFNCALARAACGNHPAALADFERALRVAAPVLGEEHEFTRRVRERMDATKEILAQEKEGAAGEGEEDA